MNNKKYYYIDFIRIFSMLAVIFLHVVSDLLRVSYNTSVWHFSNILSTLFSSSVPLFFMISGAMLLSNEKSTLVKHLYKNRIKKILFPFLFWSLFAVIYFYVINVLYYNDFNFAVTIYRLKNFIGQPVAIHFWFMYALIPIYVLLPFIKILIDNMSKKHIFYMFAIWLLFSVLLPTLQSVVTDEYKVIFQMNPNYNISLFGGYLGFFILGYYLHNSDIKIKKRYLILFIILNVILTSIATYMGTRLTGGYFENFKTYSCIPTASLSTAVFLLFKELFKEKEKIKYEKILNKISASSFAIYLMHNILIHFMNVNYFLVPDKSIIMVIIRTVFVFAACFILTLILNLLKPLSFITTGITYKGLK